MSELGDVVVITGAAGGIGSALARRYLAGGARVALLDVDADGLRSLADDLHEEERVLTIDFDVTSEDECQAAARVVADTWGGIDVLINNAGVSHLSPFADTDLAVFRRVVEINFFGSVNCTAAFLPSLVERRGRIVVLSSVAGFAPLSLRSAYSASKHALHGFFDTLRVEVLPDGVSVTVVCPSFVRTDIEDHMLGKRSYTGPRRTTGQEAEPDDVADVIHAAVAARERMAFPTDDAELAYQVATTDPAGFDELMRQMVAGETES